MIDRMLNRWAARRCIQWMHAQCQDGVKTPNMLATEALLWDMYGSEDLAETFAAKALEGFTRD